MEENRPTLIVTGFGPFGIHSVNASWEAVKLLRNMHVEDECNVRLVTEEIPVAYDEVDKMVPQLWNKHEPLVCMSIVSHQMV